MGSIDGFHRSVNRVAACFSGYRSWLCVVACIAGLSLWISRPASAVAGGFALPDGRLWELVSPENKHGAGLEVGEEGGGVIQAAADGQAITYIASGSLVTDPSGSRAPEFAQILSVRGGSGWVSQSLEPPNNGVYRLVIGDTTEYKFFSSNLALGLLDPKGETPLGPPVTAGETQERSPYFHADSEVAPESAQAAAYEQSTANGVAMGNGGFLALVTAGNVVPGTIFGELEEGSGIKILGASEDATHVALTTAATLTGSWSNSGDVGNLYEWSGGKLYLISVLPGGKPASEEGEEGALGRRNAIVRNAISNDGTRAVWEAGEGEAQHLYLSDPLRGESIAIDLPAPGANPGTKTFSTEATFQTASVDDSKVFFTDGQRLTTDSHAEEEYSDLYVYDAGGTLAEKGTLEDITKTANPAEPADVQGVVAGASREGNYVYFVANGVLAPGAVHGDCEREEPAAARCNLYVAQYDGSGWMTRLVAVLSGEDLPDWQRGRSLSGLTARVSPNGHYLAFMSDRSITGYDNLDANSGVADEEVYVYDALTGAPPVCASCDPSGARPVGRFDPTLGEAATPPLMDPLNLWPQQWLAANVPGWVPIRLGRALYQPRYLLDDGRTFFNSSDSLVPAAAAGSENVYEYEPLGQGSCGSGLESAAVATASGGDGCVALLSGGSGSTESVFLDASESGSDVFFLTASQLVPADHDSAFDVYDARECTAGSCSTATVSAPRPCASTATCRGGAGTSEAPLQAPPTEGVFGNGNVPTTTKGTGRPAESRLTRALKTCRAKPKKKRRRCEALAKRRYGTRTRKAANQTARAK